MNKTVKNYYILKSKWLPQDTVSTFMPFVINLIRSEKIESCTIEELSEQFKLKYGYRLEMFILRPILNNMKQNGYVDIKHKQWIFHKDTMPNVDLDSEANSFDEKYNKLINGFVAFCNAPDEINYNTADKIITDFIDDNNFDTKVYTGRGTLYDESDTYRYFLSGYIQQLKEQKDSLFNFIVSLCESTLIKSYMFNEGLKSSAFINKTLYIDTPIIFRLLGYYGDFYEQEYKFLIQSLIEKSCKIYIFKRNYDEVLKVLRTAEKYVESVQYDMAHSSDVCNYFRSQNMRAEDVAEEIELLNSHLTKLGIELFNADVDWDDKLFVESYDNIRNGIIQEYSSSSKDKRYLPETAINIDTDSAIHIYSLRKNNNIIKLSDAPCFYISSNFGFVNAIRKYNNEYYKETISPVISDAFIGMIISGENSHKAQQVATNKVLSFCYSAYKPTRAMLSKFVELVEQEKEASRITENDYIAIRNHTMVNDFLVQSTQNNIEELSQNTVYEVLEHIKANHIFDAQKSFDRQTQERENLYKSEIASLTKRKDEEIEKLQNENYSLRLQQAQKQFKIYKLKIKIGFGIILSLIAALLLAGTISQIVLVCLDKISKFAIISTIIMGLGSLLTIVFEIISYKNDFDRWFVKKLFDKRKPKICQKNSISIEDIE